MTKINIIISFVACSLFLCAGSVALTRQGLYYDELFQAPTSFFYIHKTASCVLSIPIGHHKIPLLNMSYTGAIKSAIYGLYLRIFKAHFSVLSWRLLGLFFVSLAIFSFGWLLRKEWPPLGFLVFFVFIVLDPSVLLMTRHDWGPVALALSLRFLFIGLWLRGEIKGSPSIANSFWLGLIAGFSLYEKLCSAVLAFPLLMIIIFSKFRRKTSHALACSIGYLLGCLVLIFINSYSWIHTHKLISFGDLPHISSFSWDQYASNLWKYLCLGNGALAKTFICNVPTDGRLYCVEGISILVIFILIVCILLLARNHNQWFKLAGISLLTYLAIAFIICAWPQKVWIHHYILGTPFQYIAIVLVLVGLFESGMRLNTKLNILRGAFVFILVLFLGYRVMVFSSVEQSLISGKFSENWSPEYTKFAEIVAKHTKDSVFIVADWGFANQMVCMGNGDPLVYEVFWNFKGALDLKSIIDQNEAKKVYIIFRSVPSGIMPENTAKILPAMKSLNDWQGAELDPEFQDFKLIRIYKFLKFKGTKE